MINGLFSYREYNLNKDKILLVYCDYTALSSCGNAKFETCHSMGHDRLTCRLIATSMHPMIGY